MRVPAVVATVLVAGILMACGGSKSAKPSTPTLTSAVALASPQDAPFVVLSSTNYVDTDDSFVIDGEVRNNSGRTAGTVTITVTVFDAKQKQVSAATTEVSGLRNVTPAGETTPFSYREPNGKKLAAKVASYQLAAAADPTDMQPAQALSISGLKVSMDQGDYRLDGRLANMGAGAAKSPEVVATFYDANGKVVRVGEAVFSADSFGPGEGDDFTFGFLSGAKLGITHYVLASQVEP